MLTDAAIERVYLAPGPTDLRKSIDGLAALVSQSFARDPFAPCLFVFFTRQHDKLKILYWEHNGFWLYYRRLERGRFRWPSIPAAAPLVISRRQFRWLLDGLTWEQPQAHRPVPARQVI